MLAAIESEGPPGTAHQAVDAGKIFRHKPNGA
jgi:hypothetical protein